MNRIKEFLEFINHDIWRMRPCELPKSKFFLIRQLRTLILTIRGFFNDNCLLRASALTFYTLMSIVPILAMAFGLAKGFGYEQNLETFLVEKFNGQQEILDKILIFSRNLLKQTQGSYIAGAGIIILLWTMIKLFGNIEYAFNDIWGVKKNRTYGRKFIDYFILVFVSTFMLIIASGVTVFVTSFLAAFATDPNYEFVMGPVVFLILKLMPFVIIWIGFIFLYMFLPNTKVSWRSGLIAGILAGTMFQLLQTLFISVQIIVTRYNPIYGSFAALPAFLIWLEMSWMIVLFGAEIAYAFQNVDTYDYEPDSKNASISLQRLVALYIVAEVSKRFTNGEKPLSSEDISTQMEIPPSLTRKVLFDLEACGVLVRVEDEKDESIIAYHPVTNPDKLTIQYVTDKLDSFGANDIPLKESPGLKNIKAKLNAIDTSVKKSANNISLHNA